jgi:hypothetical protein
MEGLKVAAYKVINSAVPWKLASALPSSLAHPNSQFDSSRLVRLHSSRRLAWSSLASLRFDSSKVCFASGFPLQGSPPLDTTLQCFPLQGSVSHPLSLPSAGLANSSFRNASKLNFLNLARGLLNKLSHEGFKDRCV